MKSRLDKLFVLLKHSVEIARLHHALPSGEEDEVVHPLLRKSLEIGYSNNSLLNELTDKFFSEAHDVTFGKSVVRVYSSGEETTFLITGAVIDLPSELGTGPQDSVISYVLMGERYQEKDDWCGGSVLQYLRPGEGDTLVKLKDLERELT